MFTKAGLRTLHEAGPELKRTISGNLEDQTQVCTVCPGSSDPPEKKYSKYLHQKIRFTQFFLLLRYFRLNINRLQSKIILGHVNYIG